jgi:tetratricopeptide (TPR) repeat protein
LSDGVISQRPASVALVPSNLPRGPADLIGRDRELGTIDEMLRSDRRLTLVPAATARLGGTGLTTLALAYAHQAAATRAFPGGVWWVAGAGVPVDALGRLAGDLRRLALPAVREALEQEPVDGPAEDLARAVRRALQGCREASLLVLDDVDAEGWLDRLPLGEVRLLSTTRDERFAFRRKMGVPPLPGAVAADLARALGARPRDGADRHALESLMGRELGGLPLAATLAALYVKSTGRSWATYAGRLRTQARLDAPEPIEGYAASVIAAVDASIERHGPDAPARRLLDGAAVFALSAVPVAWALAAAGIDPAGAAEPLDALGALGLIAVDEAGETLSMARLVHRRVRDLVPMDAWVGASRRAASAVAVWLSGGTDPARVAAIDARRAHIDEALAAAERSTSDLAWILIADRLAVHLQGQGRHEEARALFTRALKKAERLEPPHPGQVRVCLSNLAGLLVETGQAREARPLLERALAVDDDPSAGSPSSVRLSKLSRVLQSLGRTEAARPLLERALAMGGSAEDEAPDDAAGLPETARVLDALRQAAREGGVIEPALAGEHLDAPGVTALLDAVEAAVSAPTSSDGAPTATKLTTLGLALYALGHAGDARPLLERALVSDEVAHGPDHPEVAADLLNLAAVLRSLGDGAGARRCLERARGIAEVLPEGDSLRRGIETRLGRL